MIRAMKIQRVIRVLTVLALVAAGGCALFQKRLFTGQVGLQLYSVRDQMAKDIPGTLSEVHYWGVKYVELAGTYKQTPEEFKKELTSQGLDAVSGHFSYDEWKKDPEAVVREAQKLGLVYVGCAWIPHSGNFTEKDCRETAQVFNHCGEVAAKHQMHFFYHTHGYEFQPYDDGTLFDLLMRETDPRNVKFEMDIFWVAYAGQDCVALLKKYPGRWDLMHLKDMSKSLKTGLLTGSASVTNDVVFGTGQLDLPAILRAAQSVGVKWYFIEDESPVSMQQIPLSLKYLHDLK
jgi:sugar phosphate isomerase/epimerase